MGMVLIPLLLVFLGIFSPIKCQFARGYQPPPTAVEPSKFIHEDPEEAYRAKTRSFADVGTRNFHPPAPQPEFDAPETPLQILRPPGARPPLPPPSPPRFQQQRHGNAFHAPSQMPQSPGLPPLWVNPQKRISREQQMQMRRAASEWAQRRSPMRSEGSHSHILFSPPKATTGPMGPTRSLQPHEPISIFLHALLLPKNATTPHISRPHQVSLPDGMGTFINPHVIVKEVDRNTLEILRGRRKKSDASSNVVQVDAMVGSTDPRMDKKLVVAVDRELDRTIPRVLELMDRDNEKNGMNEQLRKDLESTLVEEIGKHLGETLEEVGDGVTSEDLDKIIEEGFNEVEVEEETTTQVTTMTTTHGKVTEQHMPAMVSRAPPARPPMMPHMPPGRPPMMPHMPPERPPMMPHMPPKRPPMMPHMPSEGPPMMPHMPPERPPMMPHMPPERPPMMPHMPSEGPPMMPHMLPERPPTMPHMPPERPPMMPHIPSEGPPMMPHMPPERPPTMPHMPSEGPHMMPHMPPERPPMMPHMPPEGPSMMPHMPPERPPMMPHMPPEGPPMMTLPVRPPMVTHVPASRPPTTPRHPSIATTTPGTTTPRFDEESESAFDMSSEMTAAPSTRSSAMKSTHTTTTPRTQTTPASTTTPRTTQTTTTRRTTTKPVRPAEKITKAPETGFNEDETMEKVETVSTTLVAHTTAPIEVTPTTSTAHSTSEPTTPTTHSTTTTTQFVATTTTEAETATSQSTLEHTIPRNRTEPSTLSSTVSTVSLETSTIEQTTVTKAASPPATVSSMATPKRTHVSRMPEVVATVSPPAISPETETTQTSLEPAITKESAVMWPFTESSAETTMEAELTESSTPEATTVSQTVTLASPTPSPREEITVVAAESTREKMFEEVTEELPMPTLPIVHPTIPTTEAPETSTPSYPTVTVTTEPPTTQKHLEEVTAPSAKTTKELPEEMFEEARVTEELSTVTTPIIETTTFEEEESEETGGEWISAEEEETTSAVTETTEKEEETETTAAEHQEQETTTMPVISEKEKPQEEFNIDEHEGMGGVQVVATEIIPNNNSVPSVVGVNRVTDVVSATTSSPSNSIFTVEGRPSIATTKSVPFVPTNNMFDEFRENVERMKFEPTTRRFKIVLDTENPLTKQVTTVSSAVTVKPDADINETMPTDASVETATITFPMLSNEVTGGDSFEEPDNDVGETEPSVTIKGSQESDDVPFDNVNFEDDLSGMTDEHQQGSTDVRMEQAKFVDKHQSTVQVSSTATSQPAFDSLENDDTDKGGKLTTVTAFAETETLTTSQPSTSTTREVTRTNGTSVETVVLDTSSATTTTEEQANSELTTRRPTSSPTTSHAVPILTVSVDVMLPQKDGGSSIATTKSVPFVPTNNMFDEFRENVERMKFEPTTRRFKIVLDTEKPSTQQNKTIGDVVTVKPDTGTIETETMSTTATIETATITFPMLSNEVSGDDSFEEPDKDVGGTEPSVTIEVPQESDEVPFDNVNFEGDLSGMMDENQQGSTDEPMEQATFVDKQQSVVQVSSTAKSQPAFDSFEKDHTDESDEGMTVTTSAEAKTLTTVQPSNSTITETRLTEGTSLETVVLDSSSVTTTTEENASSALTTRRPTSSHTTSHVVPILTASIDVMPQQKDGGPSTATTKSVPFVPTSNMFDKFRENIERMEFEPTTSRFKIVLHTEKPSTPPNNNAGADVTVKPVADTTETETTPTTATIENATITFPMLPNEPAFDSFEKDHTDESDEGMTVTTAADAETPTTVQQSNSTIIETRPADGTGVEPVVLDTSSVTTMTEEQTSSAIPSSQPTPPPTTSLAPPSLPASVNVTRLQTTRLSSSTSTPTLTTTLPVNGSKDNIFPTPIPIDFEDYQNFNPFADNSVDTSGEKQTTMNLKISSKDITTVQSATKFSWTTRKQRPTKEPIDFFTTEPVQDDATAITVFITARTRQTRPWGTTRPMRTSRWTTKKRTTATTTSTTTTTTTTTTTRSTTTTAPVTTADRTETTTTTPILPDNSIFDTELEKIFDVAHQPPSVDHGVVTTAPIRIDEPTPRPVQGRVESTTEKAEETHPLITFKPVSRTPTPPSPSTVTHVPSTSSSRPTVTSRPISQATQSTTARHLETTAVAQTQSRPPTQATTIETVQPQTVPSRAPIQTFSPSTPTPQPETRPTHATLLPKAQPEEHLPAHPLPPHVDTERPPLQTQPPRHEMVSVPKVPCPSSNDPSDDRKVDVVFLVDSSSSFTQYKYSQALHIVHDTVTRFNNVGPGGVQVSLIQFNLEPYLEFSLRRHNCRQFVMDDIADTEYMRGATKLGKAIDKVTKFAFTRARGDREDAENVLVVITDGMTDDDVMTPAKAARDLGIHMLVVSSPDADPPILMDLTGDANENLLLLGSTSDRLLAKKLANMILDLAVEPLSTARPQWETAPMFTDFTSSTSPPTPVSIASPTPTPTQPPTPTLIPSSRPTQARPLWTTPVQAPSREPETETEPAEETSELPFVPSGETYFQPPFGNPSESTGSTNEILVTVPLPEWVEEPSTTVGYSNVDFSATAAAPARPVWKLNTETTQNYGLQTTTPEPYVETKLQTVGYEKAAPPDNSYEEMQQPDTPAPSPEITEQPYYVPNQGGSTYEHLPEGNRKNVGGAGVSRPSIAQTPIISPDALSMQCSHTGFQVSVLVPPRFVGIIAVKGKEHDPQCSQKVDRHLYAGPHTVTMSVKVKECGAVSISSQNPAGVNTSVVINILHNGELLTVSDRSYLLQCFSPVLHDESLETRLNVRPTSRMIAETINLQSVPPKCSYTIRKDGPEGSIAGSAQLGETVYHTWTCKGTEDSNDVYGMIVKDCYATSDVHRQFPLIDSSGCSADIAVLSDPIYSNSSLTAFAESKAFGFEGDEALRFVCRVSLCTRDGDGCEGVTPPRCGGNSGSYLLSRVIRRDGDSAMESALTSDLYTQVSVSSSGTSSLKRAVNAILHNSTISAVCLVTVFAVICTALLARYSHRAHRDDTSSGYANADNQSQLDSVTSDDEDSRQRFQQFLHNFDRQQYV